MTALQRLRIEAMYLRHVRCAILFHSSTTNCCNCLTFLGPFLLTSPRQNIHSVSLQKRHSCAGPPSCIRRIGEMNVSETIALLKMTDLGAVRWWFGMAYQWILRHNFHTPAVFVRGNLNTVRYQNEILRPVCVPHLRNSTLLDHHSCTN